MIKIEFKEAKLYLNKSMCMFFITDINGLMEARRIITNIFKKEYSQLVSVTPYIPTQDPMLDRSEILKQLGISQQEDELFQEQYKNVQHRD